MEDIEKGESERARKRKTIIIVIIIAALAMSLPAAGLVWHEMDREDYGPPTYGILAMTTLANGLRFSVVSIINHVPWDDLEIELDDGVHSVKWDPRSNGLDNNSYAREYLGVRTIQGLTVSCNVSDLSGNGVVNAGDNFELTTGSVSEFPDEGLWIAKVLNKGDGSIACSISLTTFPEAIVSVSQILFGYRYSFSWANPVTLWGKFSIELEGGVNQYGGTDHIEWNLSSVDLTGGPMKTVVLPAKNLGNSTIFCNLTDSLGDGLMSAGDSFTLTTSSSFTLQTFNVRITYNVADVTICSSEFAGFPRNVTAQLLRTHISLGQQFELSNLSYSIDWTELQISLSDGVGMINWSVGNGQLDYNSTPGAVRFDGIQLGALTIFLNISLVHSVPEKEIGSGDYFDFTTGSTQPFSSSTSYVLKLTYTHTMSVMCASTFQG